MAGLRGTTPLTNPALGSEEVAAGGERGTSLPACVIYSITHLNEHTRLLLVAVCLFQGVADADVLALFSRVQGVPDRFAASARRSGRPTRRVALAVDSGSLEAFPELARGAVDAARWAELIDGRKHPRLRLIHSARAGRRARRPPRQPREISCPQQGDEVSACREIGLSAVSYRSTSARECLRRAAVRDAESAILSPFTSRRSEVCAHVALVGYTVAMPDVLAALRARLHPHRIDPDLSAFVAFPACGCGTLLWPNGPADARPERLVGAQSRRRARTAR